MLKNITVHNFTYYAIIIFVSIIIIDPTNEILKLKSLSFGFVLLCFLISKLNTLKLSVLFTLFSFFFIAVGILNAYLNNSYSVDVDFQKSFIQIALFSFLIFPLSQLSTNEILKANYIVGLILCSVILIIFIFYLSNPQNGALIYHYLMDVQSTPTIKISHREYYGIRIIAFFYKTTPFLFFSILYKINYLKSFSDYLIIILLLIPIFITGSRTPTLCGLIIVSFFFIKYKIKTPDKRLFIGFILSSLFLLLFFILIYEKNETSIVVKTGNFNIYLEDIFSSGYNFFIGSGIGSQFLDFRGYWVPYSELTYLDIFRYWGIIGGSLFILVVFYPSILIISKDKRLKSFGLAYFLYMVLSGTNPFLFCSTGWFCLMMGYTIVFKNLIPKKK